MLQPLCWRRLHAGNPPQPDGTPPLPWTPHQTPGGWWLVRRSSAAVGTKDLLAGGSVLKRLGSVTWCIWGRPTGPTHRLCPGKALLSWALPVSRCAPSRPRSRICSPGAWDGPGEGPPAAGGAFRSGMLRHCAGRVCGKMCNLFQLRRGLWHRRCHSKVWACRYPGKAPEPGAPGVAVPRPRCAARCYPAWQRGPGKAASPVKGLSRRGQGSPLLRHHPWGRQGGRFGPVQQILAEGKLGAAGCNERHARGGDGAESSRSHRRREGSRGVRVQGAAQLSRHWGSRNPFPLPSLPGPRKGWQQQEPTAPPAAGFTGPQLAPLPGLLPGHRGLAHRQ